MLQCNSTSVCGRFKASPQQGHSTASIEADIQGVLPQTVSHEGNAASVTWSVPHILWQRTHSRSFPVSPHCTVPSVPSGHTSELGWHCLCCASSQSTCHRAGGRLADLLQDACCPRLYLRLRDPSTHLVLVSARRPLIRCFVASNL